MRHTEDRLERVVREGLIYEDTSEIRLAEAIVVEAAPVPLAAVG